MVLRKFLKLLLAAAGILLIVLLIIVAGGYFAARSIDPNIFRSELEKYLTQQTGMRAELGNIAFNWGARLRLQLDGLKFYNPDNLEKLLQSDSVTVEADATALWRGKLWMPKVVISNPEVFIKKQASGRWNWQPEPKPAGPPPESSKSPVPLEAKKADEGQRPQKLKWEFALGNVEIRDGTLRYADDTVQPSFTFQIVKCEAEILPKSSLSAFHGSLKGMIWQKTEKPIEMEGDLDIVSKTANFRVLYDRDRVELTGTLKLVDSLPHFDGTLEARKLDLEALVPDNYKRGEYLTGILNSKLKLSFDGGNPDVLLRSLQSKGQIEIANGSLKNRNVVREVLEKLSPVITVAGLLGGELPPQIEALMKDPDTDFQKAALKLTADKGIMTVQDFLFESPDYQLAGKGKYGLLSRDVDLSATLRFSKMISEYFVDKIHELNVLCYPGGVLIVPFRYAGTFPDASAMPDLQYIGSRLLEVSAQELIDKGLKKLSKILTPKIAEGR